MSEKREMEADEILADGTAETNVSKEIADVLKEAIQEEEPNELSYKNEVDELMTALTAMKANSSENENMEDVLLEKSKNGDEENISVIAEASGTPVSAPKTEENLTNLGDKHSKSKKRNKRMPAVTKLVDGDFDSFKDSLLHEEHFSSRINNDAEVYRNTYEQFKYVLKSDCADECYMKFAEACYFHARQVEENERKKIIIEGSLAATKCHKKNVNSAFARKWVMLLGLEQVTYLPKMRKLKVYSHLNKFILNAHQTNPDDSVIKHCFARLATDFGACIGRGSLHYHNICTEIFYEARDKLPLFLQMENLYYICICCARARKFNKLEAVLPLSKATVIYDQWEAAYFNRLSKLMESRGNFC